MANDVNMGHTRFRADADAPESCDCENRHGDCVACKCCGDSGHHFGDDPECDNCGMPHPGFYGALRRMIDGR